MGKCAWPNTPLPIWLQDQASAVDSGRVVDNASQGELGRQARAVQLDKNRVTLFVESMTASSQRIREKQGTRVIGESPYSQASIRGFESRHPLNQPEESASGLRWEAGRVESHIPSKQGLLGPRLTNPRFRFS